VVAEIAGLLTADLAALRGAVLTPIDEAQAARIKAENLRAAACENAARIERHYELEHWSAQLAAALAPAYREQLLNAAFGPEVCRSLAGRLLRSRRSAAELADEVMDARVGRWPMLRGMYWLSRWLIRRIGRAVAGAAPDVRRPAAREGDDLTFSVQGRGLAHRLKMLFDRFQSDHDALLNRFRAASRLPEADDQAARIEGELAELPQRGDQELIVSLTRDYRPSLLGRLLVIGVFLWFPFVQPVAEGLLQMAAAGMHLTDWLHGLYKVVAALGPARLLEGLAVVGLVYIAMRSVMTWPPSSTRWPRNSQACWPAKGWRRPWSRWNSPPPAWPVIGGSSRPPGPNTPETPACRGL
jgi:hypothetical protein